MNTSYIIEPTGYVRHNPYYAELSARMNIYRRQNREKDRMKRLNAMNKEDVAKFTVKAKRSDRNDIDYDYSDSCRVINFG